MATGTLHEPPKTAAPEFVDDQIERTRTQVKFTDVATACLTLAAGVLVYLLVLTVVDHWIVGLPSAARWLALLGLLGGAGYYFAIAVLPLILLSINPIYAAHTIEQGQPSLKNSLINFLLLRDEPRGVHQVVRDALGQRAAADLADVPSDTTVDRSQLIQIGYIAAGVMAVFALYTILSPKDPFQTFARVAFPWAELARPARVSITEVKPGDLEMYHGRDLVVSAAVDGVGTEESVALIYSTADGQTDQRRVVMKLDRVGLRYEASLPPEPTGVQQDMVYRLVAGDAETPEYRITVLPAPSIVVTKIHYDYPEYTGELDLTAPREGDIRGLEGTRVTIFAEANQEIQSAVIEFDPHGGAKSTPTPLKLEIDPQNVKQARGTFTLQMIEKQVEGVNRKVPKYTSYQLRFTNGKGDKNEHPLQFAIEVTPDLPPEVEILTPATREIEVPLNGSQPIEVRAIDPDFKLTRVVIRGAISNRPQIEATLFDEPLGVRGQATVEPFAFEPKKLGLAVGDVVAVWAEASDNRTSPIDRRPDPNVASTPRFLFKIVAPKTGEPTPADMPPPEGSPMAKPNDPQMKPDMNPSGKPPMDKKPPQGGNQTMGQGQDMGQGGKPNKPNDPNSQNQPGQPMGEGANPPGNQGNPPNNPKPPKTPGQPQPGDMMNPGEMRDPPMTPAAQPEEKKPRKPDNTKKPMPSEKPEQKNQKNPGSSGDMGSPMEGSEAGGQPKQGKQPSGQPQGGGADKKPMPGDQRPPEGDEQGQGGNQQGNERSPGSPEQPNGTEQQNGTEQGGNPGSPPNQRKKPGFGGGAPKPQEPPPLRPDGTDDGDIVDRVRQFLKDKAEEEKRNQGGASPMEPPPAGAPMPGDAPQPEPTSPMAKPMPPMPMNPMPMAPMPMPGQGSDADAAAKERERLDKERLEKELTADEKKKLQEYAEKLRQLEEKHQREQGNQPSGNPQNGNQGQPKPSGGPKAGQPPMGKPNGQPMGQPSGGTMGEQPMNGTPMQGNQGDPMPGGSDPKNPMRQPGGMQPGDMNPSGAGGNQPMPMGGQPKPGQPMPGDQQPMSPSGGTMGDQAMKPGGGEKPMEAGGASGQKMGDGPMKNQAGGDQGGMPMGGENVMKPMPGGGDQKGPMGGMGDNTQQSNGQKSGPDQKGSPASQGGMKEGQPMQGMQPMQGGEGGSEAKSPGTDKKQSKTQGEGGDKSGAGSQGSGQNGKQPGNDSAGGSTPADQGSGQAEGPGKGDKGKKPGDGQVAEQPTGHAGKEEGKGSTTKSGDEKQGPGAKGNEQAQRPGDKGSQGKSKPGQDPTEGDQRGGTGGPGGRRGEQVPENQQPDGPALPPMDAGEDANPEYAREVTQLTLDYLKNQVDKPDPELLKRLGAKPDDKEFLRKFVARWEKMYQDAAVPGNTEAQAELDDTLRSLGLRPQADRVRRGEGTKDDFRDQDAARSRPPTDYERLYRAFNRATQGLKK